MIQLLAVLDRSPQERAGIDQSGCTQLRGRLELFRTGHLKPYQVTLGAHSNMKAKGKMGCQGGGLHSGENKFCEYSRT